MKLPRVSRKRDPGREARIAFRLQSLRFRTMIEKVGALVALLEDGREKMGGDYILDRHYVESLADEAIETAGSVVFDACMLVAEGGEDLYAQYDAHRSLERGMLVSGTGHDAPGPEAGEAGDVRLEPEYALLSEILEWMDGRETDPGASLMEFVKRVLVRVATGMKEPPLEGLATEVLRCTAGGVGNVIRLVNTDPEYPATGNGNGNRADTGRRLLHSMFAGATQGEASGPEGRATEERTWLAIADERRLSVCRKDTSEPLRLEAYLAEAPDTGTLFIHGADAITLEETLPSGFRIERADESVMAWLLDARGDRLEDGLVRLGSILFS